MTTDTGMRTTLNLPYQQAVLRATEALKAEGFGVLTQIDVKDVVKQKINADEVAVEARTRLRRVIASIL